jgi:hypothetical protein
VNRDAANNSTRGAKFRLDSFDSSAGYDRITQDKENERLLLTKVTTNKSRGTNRKRRINGECFIPGAPGRD